MRENSLRCVFASTWNFQVISTPFRGDAEDKEKATNRDAMVAAGLRYKERLTPQHHLMTS
jgi:hypothetical protein